MVWRGQGQGTLPSSPVQYPLPPYRTNAEPTRDDDQWGGPLTASVQKIRACARRRGGMGRDRFGLSQVGHVTHGRKQAGPEEGLKAGDTGQASDQCGGAGWAGLGGLAEPGRGGAWGILRLGWVGSGQGGGF